MQTAQVYAEITLTFDQVQIWNSVAKTLFFSLLPGITFYFQKQTWPKSSEANKVLLAWDQTLSISFLNLNAKHTSYVQTTTTALKGGTPSFRPLFHYKNITYQNRTKAETSSACGTTVRYTAQHLPKVFFLPFFLSSMAITIYLLCLVWDFFVARPSCVSRYGTRLWEFLNYK